MKMYNATWSLSSCSCFLPLYNCPLWPFKRERKEIGEELWCSKRKITSVKKTQVNRKCQEMTNPQGNHCWKVKGTNPSTNSKRLSNAVGINSIGYIGNILSHLQSAHPAGMFHNLFRRITPKIQELNHQYNFILCDSYTGKLLT